MTKPRWRRVLTFIADYSGFRWLQDDFLTAIDDAERLAESLYDVWHAIEWWDSGDWGEERARQNVEGYQIPDGKVAEDVLYRLVDVGSGVVELRAVRAAG